MKQRTKITVLIIALYVLTYLVCMGNPAPVERDSVKRCAVCRGTRLVRDPQLDSLREIMNHPEQVLDAKGTGATDMWVLYALAQLYDHMRLEWICQDCGAVSRPGMIRKSRKVALCPYCGSDKGTRATPHIRGSDSGGWKQDGYVQTCKACGRVVKWP